MQTEPDPVDGAGYAECIGRTETRTGALSPDLAGMMAAATGHPLAATPDCAEAANEDPDFSTDNPVVSMVTQPGVGRRLSRGSPLDFSAADRAPAQPAPELGEHAGEIPADLVGPPMTEIASLFDAGIVNEPNRGLKLAS